MHYDYIIIGGGIVGAATAYSLLKTKPGATLLLIEKGAALSGHQTGNNSGVIHSGLYYKPGSLKALNCTKGRDMMYHFCEFNNIPHEKCGKVVVATSENEIPRLDELERRGTANGLLGMKRLSSGEIKEYEPHTVGVEGLFVPQTGIVNFRLVVEKLAELIVGMGGEIKLSCEFISLGGATDGRAGGSEITIKTNQGDFTGKYLINCAGLHSDVVARKCGVDPEIKIIPFRGEYYKLAPEKEYLVKNLIYPVPDPAFPFLGVHFTRMAKGGVEAGPNAVPAFKREGYSWGEFSLKDTFEFLTYPGYIKMGSKFAGMGLKEIYRSLNKAAFTKALQKLLPEIKPDDLVRGGAGVRAQALDRHGKLLDDFYLKQTANMLHVLNAPSPAATASLSIGEHIASLV
ncbi:MAG: L-2-hydroxyglutarate oxidase [Ignavibacteriales bacterium]|jgi:Predicted dehydrogenase|nr:MAG: L-2-hydroxyglutarate oxidase [Ignavibacteriaceae bacterium]MBW7872814.1 L-2-hydroxyglutarate oxidase [Ignavibacteria bacterium]MCZ2143533.1 L-2-hydroxyglutarate oxidase [Ignavibacteriales bacterium]OQY71824.1 MAG: hydroxyglutarate oxidase [Ignavibacteriales bacterium UTCHB3]MBV6444410.1 L-2-hydroxyglutarate oxidase LhgO [Ignavibacteriaceae bacterium]